MCSEVKTGGLSLAVVGSRSFGDFQQLASVLGKVRSPIARIVTGGAAGADRLAVAWARSRDVPVLVHPAKWHRYGTRAGPIRNGLIVEDSDALVAFWDGRSSGTADTIGKARAKGIPVHVVEFTPAPWAVEVDEEPGPRAVVLGVDEEVPREEKSPDEIAEEGAEKAEEIAYENRRTLEHVLAGDVLDSVGLRYLETDKGAKTAIVKRGDDKGPPEDAETGERKERRRIGPDGKPLPKKTENPMNPAKLWAIDAEIATVYPPAASGAQLVVLTDRRRIILPRGSHVVRGGPLDRYRHILRLKGKAFERPARDGNGTVLLVGRYAQVVETWVPRFPRASGATVTDADRRRLDLAARAALPRAA